jgi:hypothetical protein
MVWGRDASDQRPGGFTFGALVAGSTSSSRAGIGPPQYRSSCGRPSSGDRWSGPPSTRISAAGFASSRRSSASAATGSAVLEVAQPRLTRLKLGLRMVDQRVPNRYALAHSDPVRRHRQTRGHRRVAPDGEIAASEEIRVEGRPVHGIKRGLARAPLRQRGLLRAGLEAPELDDGLRGSMRSRVERAAAG